jgi:capsid assembly protease
MPQADNQPVQVSRESLERDHAALFAALRSEFMTAGAAAETARVQAPCWPKAKASRATRRW